tara:strand:+ start:1061 stop:1543 length:483 start_codon:yes stop_codon:yes gene_type:complete
MAWGKNGTPLTLGSALDDMDITDLVAKKFNVFLGHHLVSTGKAVNITFNNNDNSVYSRRKSFNGGSDSTATSTALFDINLNGAADEFFIAYVCSISGEEKLVSLWNVDTNTAGAGNAPTRHEWVGKFAPSPDADITRIDTNNTVTGEYAASSNITALGTD